MSAENNPLSLSQRLFGSIAESAIQAELILHEIQRILPGRAPVAQRLRQINEDTLTVLSLLSGHAPQQTYWDDKVSNLDHQAIQTIREL